MFWRPYSISDMQGISFGIEANPFPALLMVEEEFVIFHAFGSKVPIYMKEPGKSRDEVESDTLAIAIEPHLNSSRSHGEIPNHNPKLEWKPGKVCEIPRRRLKTESRFFAACVDFGC